MEEQKLTKSWLRINDKQQIKALLSEENRAMLEPFFGRVSSVKAAAERAGVKLNVMHYHTIKFVELGLLRVVRVEKDRGKQVKFYTSLSDQLFFSFNDMPPMTDEERSHSLNDPFYNVLIKSFADALGEAGIARDRDAWGRRLARTEHGLLTMWTALDPDEDDIYDVTTHMKAMSTPAIMGLWNFLDLDREDAKAFQLELFALLEKYKDREGAQRYLTFLAITPSSA